MVQQKPSPRIGSGITANKYATIFGTFAIVLASPERWQAYLSCASEQQATKSLIRLTGPSKTGLHWFS
jgi:hypothetical protein